MNRMEKCMHLVTCSMMLFASTENGQILAWKIIAVGNENCFEPLASLIGHKVL